MRNQYRKWLLKVGICTLLICGSGTVYNVQKEQERQEVVNGKLAQEMVFPGGMPIGIYLETDGVYVIGTEEMKCLDGSLCKPAEYTVFEGDYIVAFNQKKIESKQELVKAVSELDGKEVVLTLRRKQEEVDVKIKPVQIAPSEYKLGIWVRDNAQGLGTLTYLTANSEFGALGHGMHDADTDELLKIKSGQVYQTTIRGVKKGKAGEPGGLEGIIVYNYNHILGEISDNTETGIYGTIQQFDSLFDRADPVQIGAKEEIEVGKASILCTIDGERQEYEVEILRVELYNRNVNKGIVIKVTDPKLLEKSGGIVQGMSGSPILQNGKLIGAVTHVLVNDPTSGYGIFIENMLEH